MSKGIRSRLVGSLVVIAASLSLGLWLLPSAGPAPVESPAPAASARPSRAFTLRPDWPVGTRYVYGLEWRGEQRVLPPMPGQDQAEAYEMKGSLRLSGELVLRSLGRSGGNFLLGASLQNVREARLNILGHLEQDAAALTAALTGREALLEVDASGALRTLRFDPKDPDLFKHQLQWLLTHAQPTLPTSEAQRQEGRWEALEATSHGQARGVYTVDAERPLAVERVRTAYTELHAAQGQQLPPQRLDSKARFSFAEAGHLSGLDHEERLLVQEDTGTVLLDAVELLQLTLREVSRFTPPVDAGLASRTEVRQPGVIAVSASLEQRLLEQRADGLTVEQIATDLVKFGRGGQLPEMNRWLWRAMGRLKLEPARCRELVPVFARPELGSQARAVVLDLLAGAGHAEAQAVLRELLETEQVRADEANRHLFLQRLGMVSSPEPETLEYLARKHASGRAGQDEHLRNASAYAMGAAVGRLASDDPKAADYNRILLEELISARTAGERTTYLRALGNAGRPENVSAVLPHVTDTDPAVRAAVAAALRKTDTPEGTQALLQLVRASERPVQVEALASLKERHLDAAALTALRDVVVSGSLRQGTEPLVVSLLEERLNEGPVVFQMLQALERVSASRDPALRTRVLDLMARMTGVGQSP